MSPLRLPAVTAFGPELLQQAFDALERWDQTGSTVPVGGIVDYGGSADPTGGSWLICDGRSLVRSEYDALFRAIGTTYGAPDGTHFNLPDFRGKTSIGVSGSHALASTGGVETVTLSASQSGLPAHAHVLQMAGTPDAATDYPVGGGGTVRDVGGDGSPIKFNTAANASASHTNMQPYLTVNKIIRAS